MKFILDLARLLSMVQSRKLYRIETLYSAALGSFVTYFVIQLPPQVQVSVRSIVCCEKLLTILCFWEEDGGVSFKGKIKSYYCSY